MGDFPISTANSDSATGLKKGSFGIGTFSSKGRNFPGIVKPDGAVLDISAQFRDTHEIFDDWQKNFDALVALDRKSQESGLRITDLSVLPPLSHPNLYGAGANYRVHAAEILTHGVHNQYNRKAGESDEDFYNRNLEAVDRRGREGTPFLFVALHSGLVGAYDDIILPPIGVQHDWELELSVVIGKTGRFATPEQAKDLVAGYVIANDLGTLDEYHRTDTAWAMDFIPKMQPTFKPCGPFIVPSAFINLEDVKILLSVNGEKKQDWPVNDMVFSIEKLLSYATERMRIMPGDIMMTGSPPGNGSIHGQFLKDGDLVEGSITYLGYQRNKCIDEKIPSTGITYGRFKKNKPT